MMFQSQERTIKIYSILVWSLALVLPYSLQAQPIELWNHSGDKKIYSASPEFHVSDFHMYPNGSWWVKEMREGEQPTERVIFNGKKGSTFDEVGAASVRNLTVSNDGKHIAYKARSGEKEFFVVDNKKSSQRLREGSHPAFSANGHFAYRTMRTVKFSMFVDSVWQGDYDYVGPPLFSPDGEELAFQAQQNHKEFIVRAGREGKWYDLVGFPAYGSHGDFAYAAFEHLAWRIVHGATEDSARYDYITFPTFSPDGRHFAFNAQRSGKWFVVKDQVEGKRYEGLSAAPVLNRDGSRLVYRAMKNGKWIIVDNGAESSLYDDVDYSPRLSENGQHLAYAVLHDGAWSVIVDGKEGKQYSMVRDIVVTNDGIPLYVARAGKEQVLIVGEKEIRRENIFRLAEPMVSADEKHFGVLTLRGNDVWWSQGDVP